MQSLTQFERTVQREPAPHDSQGVLTSALIHPRHRKQPTDLVLYHAHEASLFPFRGMPTALTSAASRTTSP